jgi:hypothetical protein
MRAVLGNGLANQAIALSMPERLCLDLIRDDPEIVLDSSDPANSMNSSPRSRIGP